MNKCLLQLLLGMLLALPVIPAMAQSPGCQVSIHADGLRNQRGRLGVTVFRTSDGWPEDNGKAVFHAGFPIEGDHATAEFTLPEGRYAIAVLHDENANQKLDRNFVGIPKEGFGFANNPRVGLSAPHFDAAAVQVQCPHTTFPIHVLYK